MLMLPGKKGSKEKEKSAREKRQKEYYFLKNKIPVGSHPNVVTWEEFF